VNSHIPMHVADEAVFSKRRSMTIAAQSASAEE
jgi:hypothetical protein